MVGGGHIPREGGTPLCAEFPPSSGSPGTSLRRVLSSFLREPGTSAQSSPPFLREPGYLSAQSILLSSGSPGTSLRRVSSLLLQEPGYLSAQSLFSSSGSPGTSLRRVIFSSLGRERELCAERYPGSLRRERTMRREVSPRLLRLKSPLCYPITHPFSLEERSNSAQRGIPFFTLLSNSAQRGLPTQGVSPF